MKYEDAKRFCHVRSGIYRTGDPVKVFTDKDLTKLHPSIRNLRREMVGKTVPKVYWKNYPISLDDRVPDEDKHFSDWEEYDPRERQECSAYGEMPA